MNTINTYYITIKNLLYPWEVNSDEISKAINEPNNINELILKYNHIIDKILNPKIGKTYKLISKYPWIYKLTPPQIKNLLYIRKKDLILNQNYLDNLSIDNIRYTIKKQIEKTLGQELKYKKSYLWSIAITHDIDSKAGLKKAKSLLKIEEKYNIRSTWFIPIGEFNKEKSNLETIKTLSTSGEMASHGFTHTPDLINKPINRLIYELKKSKEELEKICNTQVYGFRAPLLQHNRKIFRAAREAGFQYTSTTPTREYRHPMTGGPHGIETIHPILIGDIIEIPITIIQDHQLIYVHKLNAKESLEFIKNTLYKINKYNGQSIILIHPDYKIAEAPDLYEKFINEVSVNKNIRTLHEICDMISKCYIEN